MHMDLLLNFMGKCMVIVIIFIKNLFKLNLNEINFKYCFQLVNSFDGNFKLRKLSNFNMKLLVLNKFDNI